MAELEIRKTYKLYVGGEFIRTESGRYDPVPDSRGQLLANVSRGSRKDLRYAVRKARAAQPGWAGKSAYLMGQILYRMAEMLDGRAETFEKLLRDTRGVTAPAARAEVRAAIDRIVHYAGWSDKYVALLGTVNPVASSYFDFSVPDPMGVVGILAPETPDFLGLVSHLAPAGSMVVLHHFIDRVLALARGRDGAAADPVMRQRLAELYIGGRLLRLTSLRYLTRQLRGEAPGAEGSVLKLGFTESYRQMAEVATQLVMMPIPLTMYSGATLPTNS